MLNLWYVLYMHNDIVQEFEVWFVIFSTWSLPQTMLTVFHGILWSLQGPLSFCYSVTNRLIIILRSIPCWRADVSVWHQNVVWEMFNWQSLSQSMNGRTYTLCCRLSRLPVSPLPLALWQRPLQSDLETVDMILHTFEPIWDQRQ